MVWLHEKSGMAGMTWSSISRFQSAQEIAHHLHNDWPGISQLTETMKDRILDSNASISDIVALLYNESIAIH